MNPEAVLRRLARGNFSNVRFGDVRRLVEELAFECRRISGSHYIYAHRDVDELVNLQEVRGQTKPYQLRQLLRLIERYDLRLEERR